MSHGILPLRPSVAPLQQDAWIRHLGRGGTHRHSIHPSTPRPRAGSCNGNQVAWWGPHGSRGDRPPTPQRRGHGQLLSRGQGGGGRDDTGSVLDDGERTTRARRLRGSWGGPGSFFILGFTPSLSGPCSPLGPQVASDCLEAHDGELATEL